MSRIESTFSALKAQGRTALIPYVTAGFPFADITPALMHDTLDAGPAMIELGAPLSDPIPDRPLLTQARGHMGNQRRAALRLECGECGFHAAHLTTLTGCSPPLTDCPWQLGRQ